ncbi:MAG: CapA family protein [Actinomycetota bacterium]
MVYVENLSQPSIFELARSGNFQALSYWINLLLRSEGIYARVEPAQPGCLHILVEFQRELIDDALWVNTLRDRLVRFICHQLWQLNSPVVEGVRIVARLAGNPEFLWKQSVRIVTPANRYRRRQRASTTEWVKFKTLRSLLLMGSAVASFIIGCWVSYHEALAVRPTTIFSQSQPALISGPPAKRPDQVQAALEVVPVVQHNQVFNPSDPTVTLMFGGDVTLSNSFTDLVGKDYPWAFAKMDEYRQADLAMVNLENPLTRSTLRRANKQFNFKADPESVKALTSGGIDIVNLANNHTMDYEEPGLVETLETLDRAGIHHVGAGRDQKEARRPEIIEVKGQRIAYLGYYDADLHAAGDGKAGTNPRYNERIAEDIKAIREQVDWIIVNYHWGVELADYPGDWQIDLARFTIDQGADLVVGHHPHVLQGTEIYKDRPIVYSLGDFIFGGNARSDYDTAVLKVSLKGRKMKVEFLPVEVRNYQATVVKGEQGEKILKHVEQISSIFDRPMRSPVVLEAPISERPTGSATRQPLPAETKTNPPQNPVLTKPQPVAPSSLPSSSPLATPALPNLPKQPATVLPDSSSPKSESSPPANPTLPPRLYLKPPQYHLDETDPFIKEPFIKDPFISPPSPTASPTPTSHSYLPAPGTPSFTLVAREQAQTAPVLEVATATDPLKAIALPPLKDGNG